MTEAVERVASSNHMIREEHYWYWAGAIPKEQCEKIIALGEDQWKAATVIGEDVGICKTSSYRESDVAWTDEKWVYETIWPYMVGANEGAGWNYDIRAAETMQISRYDEGNHYNFHRDGMGSHRGVDSEATGIREGNTRKISLVLVLSNEFEGGNLTFDSGVGQAPNFEQEVGTLVAFPSFVGHKVTPVTAGIRHSLVAWFMGPPFK